MERDADGDFLPGTYLAVLSRSVRRSLRAAAAPVLVGVAEDLQMTAFLVVADDDEAVTDRQRRADLAHGSRRLPAGHPARRSTAVLRG